LWGRRHRPDKHILINYASTLSSYLAPDFLFLVARTGEYLAVKTIDPLRLIGAMVW
jgi:hypothetical protein